MIIDGEKAVYHVMSRTALDGFPLKDVETPVKSAALIFYEELNGVKRIYAGFDQKIFVTVFHRNFRLLPDGQSFSFAGKNDS